MFSMTETKGYPKNIMKLILAIVSVILITVITMGAVFDAAMKNITLIRIDEFDGVYEEETVKTRKSTVEEFLKENEISVGVADTVSRELQSELTDGDEVTVRRGRIIQLSDGGAVASVAATRATVGGVLEETGIVLNERDTVTPSLDTAVTKDTAIVIDRITVSEVTETEPVSYTTKKQYDKTMQRGKTVVKQKGVNGEKAVCYSVTAKNGEIISKEKISDSITKEPVTEIIVIGSKSAAKPKALAASANTVKDFSFSKQLTVTATAYSTGLAENGGNTLTAYGLKPQYGVVAVDPRVIPLGTKLYIESADGGKSWSYGYCIAGDTGGAIKGSRIDLCFNTVSECNSFGRRSAVVYVLD